MSTDDLQAIIDRIANNQHTEEDIALLQQLLTDKPQIVLQIGKNIVNIGEGKEIHIGDRIYQQWDKESIKALVKAIQKVSWRCVANLTENDYTQVEIQSTGIGFIDKLAKSLTDFSQQSVMRYGLKLAFSPHQEYFISGGNQVIKLWHTNTTWEILQEISVPHIFDLWFTCVTISPDGQLMAACKAYEIKIWRLGTSNALHTFGKTFLSNFLDVFGFDSVNFSPDGRILAANNNQDIKLWNVESGEEIAKLSGHSDKVTCVAFHPKNGKILASCSYDKAIKLWDIESKRCLDTHSAHRDAVYTLAFSPDGEILASGSNDNKIKLWYWNTERIPQTLQQHSDAVTCLVFSPDGKTLVSGSNDGTIVEWKITENEAKTFPERHPRGVTSIAFNPDGETLISGGRDQTIKVWRRWN
ncbi:WD40 repeat-containing protein [Anabaena sp. 90]|uniref:WD40 domain-containing protein n=1 Tax=Anabaena sp. 90 TaxID=46234 RepID=UPI00029B6926|nr:WD40 repeat domain-containing protein [Anabaena sp. 90]AFW96118.1 WD40 repeat-containing protein [Anabaena sp. 90]